MRNQSPHAVQQQAFTSKNSAQQATLIVGNWGHFPSNPTFKSLGHPTIITM